MASHAPQNVNNAPITQAGLAELAEGVYKSVSKSYQTNPLAMRHYRFICCHANCSITSTYAAELHRAHGNAHGSGNLDHRGSGTFCVTLQTFRQNAPDLSAARGATDFATYYRLLPGKGNCSDAVIAAYQRLHQVYERNGREGDRRPDGRPVALDRPLPTAQELARFDALEMADAQAKAQAQVQAQTPYQPQPVAYQPQPMYQPNTFGQPAYQPNTFGQLIYQPNTFGQPMHQPMHQPSPFDQLVYQPQTFGQALHYMPPSPYTPAPTQTAMPTQVHSHLHTHAHTHSHTHAQPQIPTATPDDYGDGIGYDSEGDEVVKEDERVQEGEHAEKDEDVEEDERVEEVVYNPQQDPNYIDIGHEAEDDEQDVQEQEQVSQQDQPVLTVEDQEEPQLRGTEPCEPGLLWLLDPELAHRSGHPFP